MRLYRRPLLLCAAVLLCAVVSGGVAALVAAQQKPAVPQFVDGGAPLAAARRTAIHALPFQRKLEPERIRRWMEIASECTMAEFALFLEPLTADEQKLVAKMESMQAPIVNRLHFADLRGVLHQGSLLSHQLEEKSQRGDLQHTTPALENQLYGAYDCVFASIGPPDGSPRYGDVIIRLKDEVRENGWATPFSGMHFIYAVRHQDARKMLALLQSGKPLPSDPADPLSLGFDDRLHFSHYVVTEDAWEQALAYQAILVLRNAEQLGAAEPIRQRFARLLSAAVPSEFWSTYIPAEEDGLTPQQAAARIPFGYLEGKFDDRLSAADFTAIEVPPARLEEVRSWPEAKPYLNLIRAKAAVSP